MLCNVYKQKTTVETLLSNLFPLTGVKLNEYGVIMHINAHEDWVVPPQYTTPCSEVTSEEKWPGLYTIPYVLFCWSFFVRILRYHFLLPRYRYISELTSTKDSSTSTGSCFILCWSKEWNVSNGKSPEISIKYKEIHVHVGNFRKNGSWQIWELKS